MAFTAVAALATGAGAASIGVSVFTAMSYVGIAMAVVGAVTGDKQLLKTGGLMSMMGGIGGAAEGAGLLGTSGSTAADAGAATGSAAGDAAAAGADAAAAGANTATANGATDFMGDYGSAGAAGASGASSGVGAAATMPSTASAMTDPSAALSTPATGTIPDTTSVAQGASDSLAGAQSGTIGPASVTAPSSPADMTYGLSSMGPQDPQVDLIAGGSKLDSNSFFSGVGKVWDELGPQGKAAAIQFAGGALSGANQTAMWNEKMALENRALDQRSYGSAVSRYRPGIVNSAKV